jgi:hypothetical protein
MKLSKKNVKNTSVTTSDYQLLHIALAMAKKIRNRREATDSAVRGQALPVRPSFSKVPHSKARAGSRMELSWRWHDGAAELGNP